MQEFELCEETETPEENPRVFNLQTQGFSTLLLIKGEESNTI